MTHTIGSTALNGATIPGFAGTLVTPGDDNYDQARALFNAMIDKRPGLIAQCRNESDVEAVVEFVRDADFDVAVRCGGHSVAGHSSCDDGLVIDLSPMRAVHVDPESMTATAQGGAMWQDFDMHCGRAGVATPGGVISTTGVVGFTLGGGVGWLSRTYGMTCDNVIAYRVVTLHYGVLTASRDENPELFWALRGGGGNFGVVTEVTLRVHPVSRITGGVINFGFDDASAVISHYRNAMTAAPDSLASILDFARPEGSPRTQISMISCDVDDASEATSALQAIAGVTPSGKPVHRSFPYSMWQTMLDHTAPHGRQNYWKTVFLDDADDRVIDVLVKLAEDLPTPVSRIHLIRMGGYASRVDPILTAFTARDHAFVVHIITAWEEADPALADRCVRWTRAAFDALQPFAGEGAYLNFIGDEGTEQIRKSFGVAAYDRLRTVKRIYDPDNRFHLNQNIAPS